MILLDNYRLTKGSAVNIAKVIVELLANHDVMSLSIKKWDEQIRVSQRKLWRKWMSETALAMAERDVTMNVYNASGAVLFTRPFNAQDAHELFMSQWGGVDGNGKRVSSSDKQGKKGEMINIMNKHQQFCIERGINLTIPKDSEFEMFNQ